MAEITADDKLVWDTPSGMELICTESVVMDGEEIAFTAGKKYVVNSMHPIAVPAYVRLTNDQGETHSMSGEHLRRFFKR